MDFQGKKILILSPQGWGPMRVSKHHYATELALMGSQVYFLGPPDQRLKKAISLEELPDSPGLVVIHHRLFFPYALKFRIPWLFHLLMKGHIARIKRAIGPWDIVWDFSNTHLFKHPRDFGAPVWIRHPVDFVPEGPDRGGAPDVVVSVSEVILEPFREAGFPVKFIQHGLNHQLASKAQHHLENSAAYTPGSPVKVGYVGNLRFPTIDRPMIFRLLDTFSSVEFHFWGAYDSKNPEADPEAEVFVQQLKRCNNVVLHGPVDPHELAAAIQIPDIFLLCYDASKDFNQGSNSHKVLEYLSTGKVVVSSFISSYEGNQVLVMPSGPENATLPLLLQEVIQNLSEWNSPEMRKRRLEYALDQTYVLQIARIGALLNPKGGEI